MRKDGRSQLCFPGTCGCAGQGQHGWRTGRPVWPQQSSSWQPHYLVAYTPACDTAAHGVVDFTHCPGQVAGDGAHMLLKTCSEVCDYLQVSGVDMSFVDVFADVRVPQEERHIELSLLTSQRTGHCSSEGPPSKDHHLGHTHRSSEPAVAAQRAKGQYYGSHVNFTRRACSPFRCL